MEVPESQREGLAAEIAAATVPAGMMRLRIKTHTGKEITLMFEKGSTVARIKQLLEESESIPVHQQRLVFVDRLRFSALIELHDEGIVLSRGVGGNVASYGFDDDQLLFLHLAGATATEAASFAEAALAAEAAQQQRELEQSDRNAREAVVRLRGEVGQLLRDAREDRMKVARGFDLREGRIRRDVKLFSHLPAARTAFIVALREEWAEQTRVLDTLAASPATRDEGEAQFWRCEAALTGLQKTLASRGLSSDLFRTAHQMGWERAFDNSRRVYWYKGTERVFEEPPDFELAPELVGELRTRLLAIPGVDSTRFTTRPTPPAPPPQPTPPPVPKLPGPQLWIGEEGEWMDWPPIPPTLAPGAPIGATDVRVSIGEHEFALPAATADVPPHIRGSFFEAALRSSGKMQGGGGGPIELVGESVAGCSSVVACALVSYVLHGDVDARPLLADEAAAVQNFLYLAAAASLSNLPSLYDAALDWLGQLLQVEFNALIKEAYPEAAAEISLIQPLGLTMIDGDVPNLDWLDGMSGTVKGPGGHFDDAELAAALEGSGCVTLLKMISAGELAFAEPQLTQSVFTLAASCYRVLGRLEDQSGHGDWGPDDAGRGLARLTWAQRAGLLGAYRVPPRRRPEDAHPLWHGPFEGTAAFAERIVGRAELAALPPEFKDQLRVELGSKKLKSHVAGKRAAEDSSAWLKRHRAAIDADEEAALDEATERLEALEAWPRKSDEAAAWPRRADPSEAAAAPAPAGAAQQGFEASVTSLVGQTISEFRSVLT